MSEKTKKASIYVKGDRESTDYYRMYQYFDQIKHIEFTYHQMIPCSLYKKYMPVSSQSIIIKVLIYLISYWRMFTSLIADSFTVPDILVIHRRIISRFSPPSFFLLLLFIKKRGSRVIWDFDDNIVESRELSQRCFNFLSNISDEIIVTHGYLKNLLAAKYRSKVQILPTTDGYMYKHFGEEITKQRNNSFKRSMVIVWLATSSNLKYLEDIVPSLDRAAYKLKCSDGRDLILKVICDKPLIVDCQNLVVLNIQWKRDTAMNELLNSHVGIMPLRDDPFTKGKGGFKLIQYMSVGLPCIGSAVGFNTKVISSNSGYLIPVGDMKGWENAVLSLSRIETWLTFSKCSYNNWKTNFSYERNLKFWESLLSKED